MIEQDNMDLLRAYYEKLLEFSSAKINVSDLELVGYTRSQGFYFDVYKCGDLYMYAGDITAVGMGILTCWSVVSKNPPLIKKHTGKNGLSMYSSEYIMLKTKEVIDGKEEMSDKLMEYLECTILFLIDRNRKNKLIFPEDRHMGFE